MFDRLFTAHPRSIGESYSEHFLVAGRFGLTMVGGGLAALVHAVVPGWFETAGSDTLRRLNRQLIEQRRRRADAADELASAEWII